MSFPTANGAPAAPAAPEHTHYVSLENHAIHPAMTSPLGYEDEHKNEWRGATAAEIQRYLRGDDAADGFRAPTPLPLNELPALSTPGAIKLAPDDEPGAEAPVAFGAPPAYVPAPAPLAPASTPVLPAIDPAALQAATQTSTPAPVPAPPSAIPPAPSSDQPE